MSRSDKTSYSGFSGYSARFVCASCHKQTLGYFPTKQAANTWIAKLAQMHVHRFHRPQLGHSIRALESRDPDPGEALPNVPNGPH